MFDWVLNTSLEFDFSFQTAKRSSLKLASNINPLQPGIAFLYPLKTENLKVF